ncbi:hypothetical protein QRD43_18415 [Pelomonas sp. APW6]|uniref:Uncharacterized protein n=1 Tax=Roseateles subflavus TaxID=3053353 RepID=A0ABT7LLZ7_9BURK|nr:hypothetical protein [Pelomonas sp. APW6]MDL5033889.1 hypothetical protein [Pelomonas sp. APW6]
MSSNGTRVVPTLTEVLDEQRLGRPVGGLNPPGGQDRRPMHDELVPISLDWGDEPAPADDTAGHGESDVMTPWQLVRPRDPLAPPDDAPFIDLSIDVAPVQAPDVSTQVLDVYPTLPSSPVLASASLRPLTADGAAVPPDLSTAAGADDPAAPLPPLAPSPDLPELVLDLSPLTPLDLEPPAVEQVHEEFVESVQPPGAFTDLPDIPAFLRAAPPAVAEPASLPLPERWAEAEEPEVGVPAEPPPARIATDTAPAVVATPAPDAITPPVHVVAAPPAAPTEATLPPPLDPGTLAVRQTGVHLPGVSEERLQAIIQEALDRLLRDELPSALVETLIRLSPQLSESLIESLKPSLHLHVMEALGAESLGASDGRPLA